MTQAYHGELQKQPILSYTDSEIATMLLEQDITGLYLTIIGRISDSAGVDYWTNEVQAGRLTVAQVGQSFFDQPEVINKYANLDNTAFIKSVYLNVLGREAEQDGINYWKTQLDSNAVSKDRFIEAINNGAIGDDAFLLNNKKAIAYDYMKNVSTDIDLASTILTYASTDNLSTYIDLATDIYSYYLLNKDTITSTDKQTVDGWINSGVTNNARSDIILWGEEEIVYDQSSLDADYVYFSLVTKQDLDIINSNWRDAVYSHQYLENTLLIQLENIASEYSIDNFNYDNNTIPYAIEAIGAGWEESIDYNLDAALLMHVDLMGVIDNLFFSIYG